MKNWIYLGLVRARWYIGAVRDYPRGIFCGWCGRLNTFFDDCGFFAIAPEGNTLVACKRCYEGEPGRKHIARHGLGER